MQQLPLTPEGQSSGSLSIALVGAPFRGWRSRSLLLLLALLTLDCRRAATSSTCTDGQQNGAETDIDCGGSTCGKCALERACLFSADCADGVCIGRRCVASSCQDGARTGGESDIDCGGPCPACTAGQACESPSDCQSTVCASKVCAEASCSDATRNGTETDVDCGGACPACTADNALCQRNTDCARGVCIDGRCGVVSSGSECRLPTLACDGGCVDQRFDPSNCGGCGVTCAAEQACLGGSCLTGCAPGLSACGNACVDVLVDVNHCGACPTVCPMGSLCQAGACVASCPPATVRCGPSCVRLESDVLNCGGCGQPCDAGLACVAAQCSGLCDAPLQGCDGGACIDPLSDPQNCGGCGTECPPVPNAGRVCLYGTCARTNCNTGFADCNTQLADGCEVSLLTDDANCGHCATVCTGGQTCVVGVCQ